MCTVKKFLTQMQIYFHLRLTQIKVWLHNQVQEKTHIIKRKILLYLYLLTHKLGGRPTTSIYCNGIVITINRVKNPHIFERVTLLGLIKQQSHKEYKTAQISILAPIKPTIAIRQIYNTEKKQKPITPKN